MSAWNMLTDEDDSHIKKPSNSKNVDFQCLLYPDTKNFPTQAYYCEDLVPMLVSMQEGHRCWTWFSGTFYP